MAVLDKLGFCSEFCKLILQTINNCWYTIQYEGGWVGFFNSGKGLRQGDPLAPTLFVLAQEAWSCYMNSIYEENQGLHYNTKTSMSISHLAFADDVLLFANASKNSVQTLSRAIGVFESTSGHQVNKYKSIFVVGNSKDNSKAQWIETNTCFTEGVLLFKYLGIQINRLNLPASENV